VIPEPTSFNGDDERDLSRTPRSVQQLFWRNLAFFHRQGTARAYLDELRQYQMFHPLIAEAERYLNAMELDVIAGEK
jgi:hypothetical protein